jgi:hypothetical protein
VLITTKRGKQGKGKLEYSYQSSQQQLANKVDLLNSSDFAEIFIDGRNASYKDMTAFASEVFNRLTRQNPPYFQL